VIENLSKANPSIHKMRVEGHTDKHGGAAMNLDLWRRRAASVRRRWLVDEGLDAVRLESGEIGLTRPIESNNVMRSK
jgi:outer membrane protein OmpA-like peptidoglycan-associated protein